MEFLDPGNIPLDTKIICLADLVKHSPPNTCLTTMWYLVWEYIVAQLLCFLTVAPFQRFINLQYRSLTLGITQYKLWNHFHQPLHQKILQINEPQKK